MRTLMVVLVLAAVPLGGTAAAEPGETRRDIGEFLAAERGCPPFLQNIDNVPFCEFRWWDPADGLGIWIDYAGVASDLLGPGTAPRIEGTITERPRDDGRADVTIRLQTRHAVVFGIPFDPHGPQTQFVDNPTYFGHRPKEIDAGANPSFGDATHVIRFINPHPGAPIPALLPLFSFPEEGQELVEVVVRIAGAGELRAAYGVADGSPGRIQAVQTGLFHTGQNGATADAFPAEDVRITRKG